MKQTVEEAAREHQTHFEICDAEGTISGFINGMHKQSYESFISGAEWQSKQSPWISVNERLPENEDMVFTLCKVKRSNNYLALIYNRTPQIKSIVDYN